MPPRKAKVAMFDDDSIAEVPIAVPSRGSSLLAGTVSTKLDRATLEQVVLDGFFRADRGRPTCRKRAGASGLQEFGLPYASDPVVSKHLARFLARSLANVRASETLGGSGRRSSVCPASC